MTFLAPWLLLGLLAVGVPLLLHLRRSRKSQRLVFSTTQFFDEQFLRAARRARLQDRLLMFLRMALLALLALALAQPLIRVGGLGGLGPAGAARHVAIVIDDSASMAAPSQAGTLLQRAQRGAGDLLDTLSSARGDRVTVVLAGQRETGPAVLFAQPTPDLAEVRRAIDAITPTDLATDLDAAVARAAELLGDDAAGAIYVFSDLQETALRPADALAAPPTAGLLVVRTAPDTATGNVSLDAVQYGAARPMVGVPFTFRGLVTNHGSAPTQATLQLVIDDEPVREQTVDLPAGRSQVVRFSHRFTEAGWYGGRIELVDANDAQPADDQRHFAVQVADRVRVVAVNGAPSAIAAQDELFFLRLALTVSTEADSGDSAAVTLESITPDDVTADRLAGASVVLLANVSRLSPAALEAIEHYIDRGGAALVTLGDRVDVGAYADWIGPHRLHGGLLPARLRSLVTGDEAGDVTALDTTHPVLAGFDAGDLGNLQDVRFEGRYLLEPADDGAVDVLMRGHAGAPLLLEKRFGRGRVMLFASAIDRDWSNFPLQPTFVPWVYRLVGYLAQPTVTDGNFVRTGAVVELPAAATTATPMQIDRPDGDVGYPTTDERASAAGRQVFAETERAGVDVVRPVGAEASAEPVAMFAANVPPEEASPRRLNEAELRGIIAEGVAMAFIDAPEQVATAGQVARQGYGLWDALLWLALAVALMEPWIANQLSKRRAAKVSDALGHRDALPGEARLRTAAEAAEPVGAARPPREVETASVN